MPIKATDKSFLLRLSIDLYEFFKQEAKKNRRSVNTEILIAVEERKEKIEKQQKK